MQNNNFINSNINKKYKRKDHYTYKHIGDPYFMVKNLKI